MIDAFEIEGFKCFAKQTIELGAITVLCGVNGAGKSSVVQALLLAHLASSETHVALNGPLGMCLGQALDVMRGIQIGLTARSKGGAARWLLSAEEDEALVLRVDERPGEALPTQLGAGLTYLQAERLGPRDLLAMDSSPSDQARVGSRGEFVAQVLDLRGGRLPVPDALCRRAPDGSTGPKTLPKQAEAWLQELVPGMELRVEGFPSLTAATVRLRRSGQATEWLRAQNIGFGVSYVLPIIVAGLVAKPGSMVLVENPEAHLHPRGQSVLAQFLGRVAMSGVQVVVETHSDQFLNGLRLAAVSDHPLGPDDLVIQFLSLEGAGVRVQRIGITDRGGLTEAPAGFFDQSEKDLPAILKARRRA